MIISTTANLSPLKIFNVAETLPEAFTAVELTSAGVKTAGASSVPAGILIDGLNIADATVQVIGSTYWKVGGQSICAGDLLSSDANGRAVKASGTYALAMALENASASSSVEVQIVHAGIAR